MFTPLPSTVRQRGSVMIITLIAVTLLIIIGTGAMKASRLDERMTSSMADRYVAEDAGALASGKLLRCPVEAQSSGLDHAQGNVLAPEMAGKCEPGGAGTDDTNRCFNCGAVRKCSRVNDHVSEQAPDRAPSAAIGPLQINFS